MAKKRKGSRFPDAPGSGPRNKKQKPNAASGAASQRKQPNAKGGGQPKGSTAQPHAGARAHKQYHKNQEPVVPFSADENILLIGEGDLSFAASLALRHGCRNLTATVLEKNEAELAEKYPHVGENIERILHPEKYDKSPGDGTRHGDSAEKPDTDDASDEADGDAHRSITSGPEGDENDDDDDDGYSSGDGGHARDSRPNRNRILYATDATTLKPFLTKPVKPSHPVKQPPPRTGVFDRIVFNFPHVGGKSTDVNRQVRHNQSLLVAFFERALPSLRPDPDAAIIVTIFDGEPYTLWNVRDLARHAGLAVDRSFRFPWESYPGYKHARTLGVVKAGAEDSKTAWKGEDRPARSYVFKRKEDIGVASKNKKKGGRAGAGGGGDSDSDSE